MLNIGYIPSNIPMRYVHLIVQSTEIPISDDKIVMFDGELPLSPSRPCQRRLSVHLAGTSLVLALGHRKRWMRRPKVVKVGRSSPESRKYGVP